MPIPTFLKKVSELLASGSATEHSYRAALAALFESIPGLQAINEPKHEQHGAPDFVINRGAAPIGHVEAKDIGKKLDASITDSQLAKPKTDNGRQLQRYRAALPNLLYTDGLVWHWFVQGEPRLEEPVTLATWNASSKKLTPTPTGPAELEKLLTQFTNQTLATVSNPRDLAERLARIAHWLREVIKDVFDRQTSSGALHQQLEAFRETLLPGLSSADFADMYAQTIVYGLFAARVSQPNKTTFTRIDASQAIPKTNPFLRTLFQQIAGYDLDERIAWLVDDCAALLEHTVMDEVMHDFGRATRQEDPVVHFYETFLAAYDPKMREARGVYYTPEPVVGFIVRSVHNLLQTHFKKPMGLADEHTIILDPATGTATFLHAVVQHIHRELADQGLAGMWDSYVPEKLLKRIFGFELLMAPYTIAHLKLGLLLKQLGYAFSSDQRLGVYLTNTLSQTSPAQYPMTFGQNIAEEGQAANEVKRNKDVMVILGNPPYSGHSANKSEWITGLIDDYKKGFPESEKLTQPKWLQNDYVKFIRFSQWKINNTGEGIIAFITGNVYLDNPTFIGMRRNLLGDFDCIYILNLHGHLEKKEKTPSGDLDENVFDIKQGVSIVFLIKNGTKNNKIYYYDVWGEREYKYQHLKLSEIDNINWIEFSPRYPKFSFIPSDSNDNDQYGSLHKIDEIMNITGNPTQGIVTTQDQFAISWTRSEAEEKINKFLETSTEADARELYRLCTQNQWNYHKAKQALSLGGWRDQLTKILYRPFDLRWTIYNQHVAVHRREKVMQHLYNKNNIALITTRQTSDQWDALVTETVCGHKSCAAYDVNSVFPLYVYPNNAMDVGGKLSNFSPAFIAHIAERLGLAWIGDGRGDLEETFGPEDVFHYIYAVFHSPAYRERYAEFLKIDFPRLPLTSDVLLFATLAGLGAQLVDLHLLRLPGAGGVGGAGGAAILQSPGKQGVTFPDGGSDLVGRIVYVSPIDGKPGEVRFNETQRFVGIDPEIWEMQIGGYQPLEKWLKDRRGRTLSSDEIMHYPRMVIALRETRRLMQEIDEAIPGWPMA